MPKAIKKKAEKKGKPEENIVGTIQEAIRRRQKTLLMSAGAALAIMIIAAGAFYFLKSRADKFEELNYTGYKLFYGIGTPMPPAERYKQALAAFEEAGRIKKSPYTLYYAGASRYELGDYDKALKSFSELKASYPADENYLPLAGLKTAMIYIKTGRNEEALKELDRLINSKNPSLRDTALAESANLLKGMGREEEAAGRLARLKKEFPESPYVKEEAP